MHNAEADDYAASVKAQFGQRVRETRKARGLSQGGLAEMVSLDRSAITRIENGERDPKLSESLAIASALALDLSSFVTPTVATYQIGLSAIQQNMSEARELIRKACSDVFTTLTTSAGLAADIRQAVGRHEQTIEEMLLADVEKYGKSLASPKPKTEIAPRIVTFTEGHRLICESIIRGASHFEVEQMSDVPESVTRLIEDGALHRRIARLGPEADNAEE